MITIKDFSIIVKEMVPIIKELFKKSERDDEVNDKQKEKETIKKLKELVSAMPNSPDITIGERLESLRATRHALEETIFEASRSNISLSSRKSRTIRTQIRALRNKESLMSEVESLRPISKILSVDDVNRISDNLDGAKKEIEERQNAKRILDTTVDVLIIAAKIAAKLAI